MLQRQNDIEALSGFRRAVELQPDNPDAHNNLGLAMVQAGQGRQSVAEFQVALRFGPTIRAIARTWGRRIFSKPTSNRDHTIADSAERHSRRSTLHYNLGLALKLKDQLPEALAEFRKAEELDPSQPDVHYTLGVTLWQQGAFDDAVKELRAAIFARNDYAEAYYTLGTVQKQQGKLPEAADALREAIRLQPDFAGAHTTLASVLRA